MCLRLGLKDNNEVAVDTRAVPGPPLRFVSPVRYTRRVVGLRPRSGPLRELKMAKTTKTETSTQATAPVVPDQITRALSALHDLTNEEIARVLQAWALDAPVDAIKTVRRWAVTPIHGVRSKTSYNGPRLVTEAKGLTPKEVEIRSALLALEGDDEHATYEAVSALTGLGVSQVAGSTSVLLSKGFVEVHRKVVDDETGRTESVLVLTDEGRNAEARPPKAPKPPKGGKALPEAPAPSVSGFEVPAWSKSVTVAQIVKDDWDLTTQTLDDLEEAMAGKSPKTKLSTLWANLPSATVEDLVSCWTEAHSA